MGNLPFGGPPADWLSHVDEEENPEINEQHCCSKDPGDNSNSICLNPGEDGKSKSEGQSSLASNENTEQFSCVTIITINLVIS